MGDFRFFLILKEFRNYDAGPNKIQWVFRLYFIYDADLSESRI